MNVGQYIFIYIYILNVFVKKMGREIVGEVGSLSKEMDLILTLSTNNYKNSIKEMEICVIWIKIDTANEREWKLTGF